MKPSLVESRLGGEFLDRHEQALALLDEQKSIFRLWARDSLIFTGKDEGKMLDWLFEPKAMLESLPALLAIKSEIERKKFAYIVLLGMGGSSLAPRVFQTVLAPATKDRFFVVDTIHPEALTRLHDQLDYHKTLFIVSSKSGGTLETDLLYRHFFQVLSDNGAQDPFGHFMAITDPTSPLEQEASECGFLRGPFGKPGIGGRYSALSPFGIMPALLMDIPVQKLVQPASALAEICGPTTEVRDNPAAILGAFFATIAKSHDKNLMIHVSASLGDFGVWLEQLMAESLGKHGLGVVPVIVDDEQDSAITRARAHLYIETGSEQKKRSGVEALEKNTPIVRVTIDEVIEIGSLMYLFSMGVALAGSLLKINPFDQPDVEKSKVLTKSVIQKKQQGQNVSDEEPEQSIDGMAFLGDIQPTDYVALLSYLDETHEHQSKLHDIARIIANKTKAAVMVQNGPRYLHSTGQLFKGGTNTGHFLVITGAYRHNIPSHIAGLSLADIHLSQALGDVLALKDSGRRVFHLSLKDAMSGLNQLSQWMSIQE